MPLSEDSPRAEILDEAKKLILGDRNPQYGEPTQNFDRTAQILNAQGYRGPGGAPIQMHDVALIVIGLKLARMVESPEKRDTWADIAGYVGCGWETIVKEMENRDNTYPLVKRHRIREFVWRLRGGL